MGQTELESAAASLLAQFEFISGRPSGVSSVEIQHQQALDTLIASASTLGPPMPHRLMLSLLTELEHLPKQHQLRQFTLIAHWAAR
jgi:hypothetical protein